MKASSRVVLNTGILHAKLIIVMILGFFTIRLVLDALGETDYGIYSLVAGVVGLLAILQSAMANASMRFMAHSLGSGDEDLISKTFNTTLLLHFIIGLFVIIILEVGGLLMFEYLLNIPEDKLFVAKVVFHFMVITTFVTIIAVPYDAVINAHENMLALSLVDILGAFLKLGIAVFLTYLSTNLLIIYGGLMLAVQIIQRVLKQWYSVKHYKECRLNIKKFFNKSLARNIFSFSGWNLFGSAAAISVNQIKSILLNMFFGVHLNAANGIAMQSTSKVNLVSISMTRAINPQLVKSEGSGDRQRMLMLTEKATKFSVFLFSFFAIPVIIEMPYLLNLWLIDVPDYAIVFSRLILVGLLLDKLSFEITSAIRAVGRIRNFTIINASIIILNVPISYLLFSYHFPPYSIFIVNIFITIVVFFVRLILAKKLVDLNINNFIKNAIIPVLLPIGLTFLFSSLLYNFMEENLLRTALTFFISIIFLTVFFRYIGLKKDEYEKLKNLFYTGIREIRRKFVYR